MTVPSSPNVRINNQRAMILSSCCFNFHQPTSTNLADGTRSHVFIGDLYFDPRATLGR